MKDPFEGLNDAVAELRKYVDAHPRTNYVVAVVYDYTEKVEKVFGPFKQIDIMSSSIWAHGLSGRKFELGIKNDRWWEVQIPEEELPTQAVNVDRPLVRGVEVWIRPA